MLSQGLGCLTILIRYALLGLDERARLGRQREPRGICGEEGGARDWDQQVAAGALGTPVGARRALEVRERGFGVRARARPRCGHEASWLTAPPWLHRNG